MTSTFPFRWSKSAVCRRSEADSSTSKIFAIFLFIPFDVAHVVLCVVVRSLGAQASTRGARLVQTFLQELLETFKFRFDNLLVAGWANAVAELGFRMRRDVTLNLLPIVVIVSNVFAV